MNAVRIDEILLRRGGSSLIRVMNPAIPAHEESVLGHPFGLITIDMPRSPQIDNLVAEIETAIGEAYAHGSLKPNATPEVFFEETVGKVRAAIAKALEESRIKLDPTLFSMVLGAVAGNELYLTRHGRAEAYLIRREPQKPTRTMDVFRGFDNDGENDLMRDMVVGAISENDMLLCANSALFESCPIADIIDMTERSEPAAVAARIRSMILGSPISEAVAGFLVRLSPVRVMFRAKENSSVMGMRSREEEVARTLSPSGLPTVSAFIDRFKSKDRKEPALKKPKAPSRPLLERFNSLPLLAKQAMVGALALLAIFAVSVKIISNQNVKKQAAQKYSTSIDTIKRQIDAAESATIYDENRGRTLLDGAIAAIKELNPIDKKETEARDGLNKQVADAEKKLKHLYDVTPKVVETLGNPSNFILKTSQGYLTNAGANLVLLADNGSPSNIATLPAEPLWAAMADDTDATIYLWLKNGTLVALSTKNKSLPRAIDYQGPENPLSGAFWSGKLYVLDATGTQVWKLPTTIGGIGRGATWLATPLSGQTASSIAIDGSVYLAIKNDGVRRFEKGKMSAFAADGANANTNPGQVATTDKNLYLADDTSLAVWDKNGKLTAQYSLSADKGKITSYAVDENIKTVTIATDKGIIARFDLVK